MLHSLLNLGVLKRKPQRRRFTTLWRVTTENSWQSRSTKNKPAMQSPVPRTVITVTAIMDKKHLPLVKHVLFGIRSYSAFTAQTVQRSESRSGCTFSRLITTHRSNISDEARRRTRVTFPAAKPPPAETCLRFHRSDTSCKQRPETSGAKTLLTHVQTCVPADRRRRQTAFPLPVPVCSGTGPHLRPL